MTGAFEAPGLDHRDDPAGADPVEIALAAAAALPTPAERLAELPGQPGPGLTIDRAEDGAYLFAHDVFGRFSVSGDGRRVACAPAEGPAWRWQRFLTGQVLPLVAVLAGAEVLHASVVARRGRGVLALGPSGAGKSTFALGLVARGATFMADDVAAITPAGDGVVVHPGPPLVTVADDEAGDFAPTWRALHAREVGRDAGEARFAVEHGLDAVPVHTVCVLDPVLEGESVQVEDTGSPNVAELLGMTFVPYLSTPQRLVTQFDCVTRVAATARAVRVRAPRSLGVAAMVDAVAAWLDDHAADGASRR